MSLTSSGVGAQTTSTLTGPQPNVFLGPLLSYPTATGTTPTNDGTKLSFASASSQFLNFGSQTFDMTKGFSVTCKFAFTGTAGTDEVILNFDSIRLTRSGTTGSIKFTYYNGTTAYSVTSTNTVAQGQVNTVTVFYTHSPVSLSIILNGVTTTSTPAAAATTPRTITNSYVGFPTTSGQNLFVAVAYSSNIAASSTDGITWTPRTLPSSSLWRWVTVNPTTGVFVAIAVNSDSAASSTDGINWTPRTLPSVQSWFRVTVNPTTGVFVAVCAGSTAGAYSTDGFTWTPTNPLPSASTWHSVTVNPTTGVFVAVAYGSTAAASSTDGITWTARTLPFSRNWTSVTVNPTTGIFAAVAAVPFNTAAYSTDGFNWSPAVLPYYSEWSSVTCNPTTGIFVAVISGIALGASSTDGITWTGISLPSSALWQSVAVNPTTGIFVTVAYSSNAAASSTDGIDWTPRSLPSSEQWLSVTASASVSSGNYLNGDIYSLNIYNRELTPNEVTGPPAPSPWGIFTALLPEIGSTPNSTFTDVTGTTIGLSWVENLPIYTTSYRVYAYNAGSLTLVGFQNAASSPYIYTGLQTNSGYYFKIAGVNTVGVGPQSAASVSAYTNIPYTGSSGTINVSPGTYKIRLAGGVGGGGGSGRLIEANFTIDATISMKYVIGGAGATSGFGGAGGGATYMYDLTNSRALFVAGAGGGGNAGSTANPGTGSGGSHAGYAGAGGGLFGDGGTSGGQSFFNGSAGGTYGNTGAFGGGGGGGSSYSGGGGGGYTGGNGAGVFSPGGGGGGTSYAIPSSTVLTDSASNTSNGYINMKPLVTVLNVTSGTNTVIFQPGTYTFSLAGGVGGTGGSGTRAGGRGMILNAVFTLSASTSIKYVVGGSGGNFGGSGGGGGGSYVYDLTNSRALFVAAGGGGAGSNSPGNNATGSASPGTGAGGGASYASGGGGGGGLFGNGTDAGATGGKSFLVSASPVGSGTSAGGTYGNPAANGGFGGGGAGGAGNSGGGGGGYTGGNQLGASVGSNGGTSYAIAGSSGLTESATNTSRGYIIVSISL